jgi:hypothetical protein
MPDPHPNPPPVHRLPAAPHFVGREPELAELRRLWQADFHGVIALVGLGGAGKTAVAARFVDELLRADLPPRPDDVFVWSFYQEPDAGLFLRTLHRHLSPAAAATPARGTGLLHLIREALADDRVRLLVLDGLERVQRQETDATGRYGQLEDPLLQGLLARAAEGLGRTVVLVTSRFPLTDLQAPGQPRYRHVDVGGLEPKAARGLLRQRGVQGDDAALDELLEKYGAHALTLDHLGGLIGGFLGGDPRRAPEAPALAAAGQDRQALRLARLLRRYEEHLPPAELALLCRLCLLRRSVTKKQLGQLLLCSPAVHLRTAREIADQVERFSLSFPGAVAALDDLAAGVEAAIEEALCAAPVAGPEDVFRHEVLAAAGKVVELEEQDVDVDVAELARVYADSSLDAPTDQRPLSAVDRQALRDLCVRHLELREHPLLSTQALDSQLAHAFWELGWKKSPKRQSDDLAPADVVLAFKRVRLRLRFLTYKHFLLQHVRQLCQFYQRKWELAGPLAHVDAAGLRELLSALVGRHLVLCEADGSYSIHPAVRDHFYQRATASEQASWHDLLREQMVSLIQRPGARRPEDAATLDLVEEAVHHALRAGRPEEAWGLYEDVLGGVRHLGWKLGEMARGLRILRQFEPCPDGWSLGWFLRALGEYEPAYQHNPLPYFRADVRLLQGRLPEVAAEGEESRAAVAAFLMGRTQTPPPLALGCPVTRAQCLLYLGRLPRARQAASVEGLYQDMGWEGDRARCQLVLAEVARRQADLADCRRQVEAASVWILHSGSVEHLCLYHLIRARAARSGGHLDAAGRAVKEGLHLAGHAGLRLYQVETGCEEAELALARGDAVAAEAAARQALRQATAKDCHFLWGVADAGRLVGLALNARDRPAEARQVWEETLNVCRQIGDPRAEQVEALLARLGAASQ